MIAFTSALVEKHGTISALCERGTPLKQFYDIRDIIVTRSTLSVACSHVGGIDDTNLAVPSIEFRSISATTSGEHAK